MKTVSFRNDVLPLKNELFRLALRITLNKAEAEDVVQETMVKVWNRRDSWGEIDSIEAFCIAVCRNLALDKAKRMDNNNREKQRTVMQLRDIEGKSYKDIAAALAISQEQVKVSLYRARQAVKQKFIETERYGL